MHESRAWGDKTGSPLDALLAVDAAAVGGPGSGESASMLVKQRKVSASQPCAPGVLASGKDRAPAS